MIRDRAFRSLSAVAFAAAFSGLALVAAPRSEPDDAPLIAVATSLRPAVEQIARLFEETSGQKVRLSFAATGTLVHQIENGAGFAMLLAADEASVERLADAGLTAGPPRRFVRGRLVLAVSGSLPLFSTSPTAQTWREIISGPGVKRVAVANPKLAPYGRAALQAMRSAKVYDVTAEKLVFAHNVADVAVYLTSGAAEAGLIAHSIALMPRLKGHLAVVPVGDGLYRPIFQAKVLMKKAGRTARDFNAFLQGAEARRIFENSGFDPL